MSFYMKFNGWTGDNVSDATARLAKMFRMDSGKASQAMRKIIRGQNWQFKWPISNEQAKVAHSYFRWLGFDLELNPAKQLSHIDDYSETVPTVDKSFSKISSPNLLDELVELTGNICNAFTVALYRIDLEERFLVLRHHISLSLNFDPKAKIKLGKGLIGKVAETRRPFLEENSKQNSSDLCIYKKDEDLKSFFATPIVYKNLEGVLTIDSKQSYSFSAKQQKIITGLAKQMAWHLNQERNITKYQNRETYI